MVWCFDSFWWFRWFWLIWLILVALMVLINFMVLMILLISSAIIQVKSKLEMDSKRYSIFMILIKAESSNSSKSNMLPDKSDKTWLMMLFWIWCTQFLSITKQPQTSQFHSKNSIQWYLLIIIRRKIKENSKSFDLNELFNLMNILT